MISKIAGVLFIILAVIVLVFTVREADKIDKERERKIDYVLKEVEDVRRQIWINDCLDRGGTPVGEGVGPIGCEGAKVPYWRVYKLWFRDRNLTWVTQ